MSKIRFVLCLSVLFVLSGNVAGAVDLTGTWDWYGVEMSITQTGQQVNAFINISQPDIGNKAGDQMFCGTLNGQTLTGKIKVHGTPEYKTLCPATYFNFTDVTITVSADENTLQGQLKNVFMNNDCTITPSENWVSMGTLTKKNNTPAYSGSGSASACSGGSSVPTTPTTTTTTPTTPTTPTTTSTQCIQVDDNLTIPIACAEYKSAKYKFDLNYASDLYWKMNLNTFGSSNGGGYCLSVGDDLRFNINCAEYKGNSYGFAMNYSPEHGDSQNFYWKIDLNTFVQKNPTTNDPFLQKLDGIDEYQFAQIATVQVNNANLTQNTYDAKLGDKDIVLVRSYNNVVSFMMPDIAHGEHILSLQIDGKTCQLTLKTKELSKIDPEKVIYDFKTMLLTDINDLINSLNKPESQAIKADFTKIMDDLNSNLAELSALGKEDKQWLAAFIQTNFNSDNSFFKSIRSVRNFDPDECWKKGKDLARSNIIVIAMISAVVYSSIAIKVPSLALPLLFKDLRAVGIFASLTVCVLAYNVYNHTKKMDDTLKYCFGIVDVSLNDSSQKAKRDVVNLNFESGKQKSFYVRTKYAIQNSDVLKTIKESIALLDILKNYIPLSLFESFNNIALEKVETSVSGFTISDISDKHNISGSVSQNDKLGLTFFACLNQNQEIPFTFNLNKKSEGFSKSFSAKLKGQQCYWYGWMQTDDTSRFEPTGVCAKALRLKGFSINDVWIRYLEGETERNFRFDFSVPDGYGYEKQCSGYTVNINSSTGSFSVPLKYGNSYGIDYVGDIKFIISESSPYEDTSRVRHGTFAGNVTYNNKNIICSGHWKVEASEYIMKPCFSPEKKFGYCTENNHPSCDKGSF